jgi:hypothetical protein
MVGVRTDLQSAAGCNLELEQLRCSQAGQGGFSSISRKASISARTARSRRRIRQASRPSSTSSSSNSGSDRAATGALVAKSCRAPVNGTSRCRRRCLGPRGLRRCSQRSWRSLTEDTARLAVMMTVIVGVLPSRCRDVLTMGHRAWQEMGDGLELSWSETIEVGQLVGYRSPALSSLKGLDLSSWCQPRLVDLFLSFSAIFGQRRLRRRGPGSAR